MRTRVAHKSKIPRLRVKITVRSEVKLYLKLCCSETSKAKDKIREGSKSALLQKNNEIWLFCMCMSSVTENDSF